MATYNLDHAGADAMSGGSAIHEEVMERLWISNIFPLTLTDKLGKMTTGNRFAEFIIDELSTPVIDNRVVDGADSDQQDQNLGERNGNHIQISTKEVRVSSMANAARSVGRHASLTYQVMRRQQDLRRDVDAQMCTQLPSVQDDGATVAGQSAGLGAWIKTNTIFGATGTDGGYNPSTKIVDAPSPGTKWQLTEKAVRDALQAAYMEGGNTDCMLTIPQLVRAFSEYCFTSSARIAIQQNQKQGENAGKGSTAYGSVTVYASDFGQTIKLEDSRIMRLDAGTDVGVDGVSSLYFLDPEYLKQSFIRGYMTERLGKSGLSEKRMISVHYTLLVTNEKTQAAIRDVDTSLPVVAG